MSLKFERWISRNKCTKWCLFQLQPKREPCFYLSGNLFQNRDGSECKFAVDYGEFVSTCNKSMADQKVKGQFYLIIIIKFVFQLIIFNRSSSAAFLLIFLLAKLKKRRFWYCFQKTSCPTAQPISSLMTSFTVASEYRASMSKANWNQVTNQVAYFQANTFITFKD